MKLPTKKLVKLAHRYNKVVQQYEVDGRAYIRTATPSVGTRFWDYVDHMRKQIHERMQFASTDPIKDATHNTILHIMKHTPGSKINKWMHAARFLATYEHIEDKLSAKCWEMPGVHKGDDSYGDWMDALPLVGEYTYADIMSGELASYKQVSAAVEESYPDLHSLIMEGENYIRMKFTDCLLRQFRYAVELEEEV